MTDEKKDKFIAGFAIAIATVSTIAVTSATIKSCKDNINLNKNKSCTMMIIHDKEIDIYDNVPFSEESFDKYKVLQLNDQNCIVYVFGDDSSLYSDFIASNIYFDENNKVIIDTININQDNYEYYCNPADKSMVR